MLVIGTRYHRLSVVSDSSNYRSIKGLLTGSSGTQGEAVTVEPATARDVLKVLEGICSQPLVEQWNEMCVFQGTIRPLYHAYCGVT